MKNKFFLLKKISDISMQPINMQHIKAQIDEIVNNNKNECMVS
jgi:hypothetical protein